MATEEGIQKIAKSYVNRLARNIKIRRAILTGSWANGTFMEDSDVDIIVVSDDFANMELPARLQYLQREWKSRVPLEAFGYTMSEFQNLSKRSTYVKDAIRNGRSLLSEKFDTLHPGFNYNEARHEASRFLFASKEKKVTRKNERNALSDQLT